MRTLAWTGLVGVALALAPTAATAEPGVDDGLVWGMTGLQISAAVAVGVRLTHDGDWGTLGNVVYGVAPFAVGVASGFGSHAVGLPARAGYAVHGAGWLGLDLALVGALIDGDGGGRYDRLRIGPATWTLGAVGVLGGAWLGARGVRVGAGVRGGFLGGPAVGAMAGTLLAGLVELARPSNHTERNLTLGAITGITVGLGVGWLLSRATPTQERRGSLALVAGPRAWAIRGSF